MNEQFQTILDQEKKIEILTAALEKIAYTRVADMFNECGDPIQFVTKAAVEALKEIEDK